MVLSHHQFPAPETPFDNGAPIRTERMIITGRLDVARFLPWIRRHSAKLGIHQTVDHADEARIELTVMGPVELIDALEMGCSLGPISVWVEDIQRADAVAAH